MLDSHELQFCKDRR
jgi:hypothetical protein